jgi:hypothetical protein
MKSPPSNSSRAFQQNQEYQELAPIFLVFKVFLKLLFEKMVQYSIILVL